MQNQQSILIIDDSSHVRFLLLRMLNRLGFITVDSADDGIIGLEKVHASPPDLIFLDGIMPGKDGLAVLKEVKQCFPEIVVIMSTSLTEREKIFEYKNSGADFYLLKPFEDTKLKEILSRAIPLISQRKQEVHYAVSSV
ncbi:MAG: response regulator [bacterium]